MNRIDVSLNAVWAGAILSQKGASNFANEGRDNQLDGNLTPMDNGQSLLAGFITKTTSNEVLPDQPEAEREIDSDSESVFFLTAMILHEDVPTALRAKSVIDRLEAEMELKVSVNTDFWKVENLDDFELRELALKSAGEAQMLFVSLHGQQEISPIIRAWLASWVRDRNAGPRALILSLDEAATVAQTALTQLRNLAAGSNVMVFPHFEKISINAMIGQFQCQDWPVSTNRMTAVQ